MISLLFDMCICYVTQRLLLVRLSLVRPDEWLAYCQLNWFPHQPFSNEDDGGFTSNRIKNQMYFLVESNVILAQ